MIASVIAILAAGAAASGSPPASSAPPSPKPAVVAKTSDLDDQNKVICHTEVPIGSRLGGVRECKTRAEWAEERRVAQQAVENQQSQGISNPGK